jgi:hypothetical protein
MMKYMIDHLKIYSFFEIYEYNKSNSLKLAA